MKEAIVHPGPRVEIIESPIPTPDADQVLIKVIVSGSNPKDYKMGDWFGTSNNTGDDIAGIVHSVGENITEFKPGDRVAAYHQIGTKHGSYAEYAVAWAFTTFHLPKKTSFEGLWRTHYYGHETSSVISKTDSSATPQKQQPFP